MKAISCKGCPVVTQQSNNVDCCADCPVLTKPKRIPVVLLAEALVTDAIASCEGVDVKEYAIDMLFQMYALVNAVEDTLKLCAKGEHSKAETNLRESAHKLGFKLPKQDEDFWDCR